MYFATPKKKGPVALCIGCHQILRRQKVLCLESLEYKHPSVRAPPVLYFRVRFLELEPCSPRQATRNIRVLAAP